MTHKMGLVSITLKSKSVTAIKTRTYNNVDGTTYSESSSGSTTISASNNFSGNIPMQSPSSSNVYYFITRANTGSTSYTTTFKSDAYVPDNWNLGPISNGLSNTYNNFDAETSRTFAKLIALYPYSGKGQTTILPWPGTYTMECWGSAGKDMTYTSSTYYGGHGGYTIGNISIKSNLTFYVYVGNAEGYNGGGVSNTQEVTSCFGNSGGGATDIRVIEGTGSPDWKNFSSLKSRIMVAGGGGGANNRRDGYGVGNGGYGGGVYGGDGSTSSNSGQNAYYILYGGKQNAGGSYVGYGVYSSGHDCLVGKYGYAQSDGSLNINGGGVKLQSSGGGGWYGGAGGLHCGGGGGSSFIAGFTGCLAINQSSTESSITHLSNSNVIINSVPYTFSDYHIIDGAGYEWNASTTQPSRGSYVGTLMTSGSNREAGNPSLTGYARITSVD